ncbi:hypothetical protein C789_189 [Microcystis aeruginosa FACHB-905 = DIANCHI905]|nr:hypothetical protein C789_189 [Microcystis aeruginosa FACHB-905 = DIANCHI905]
MGPDGNFMADFSRWMHHGGGVNVGLVFPVARSLKPETS